MKKIDEVVEDEYYPTKEDILRVRIPTTGIEERRVSIQPTGTSYG